MAEQKADPQDLKAAQLRPAGDSPIVAAPTKPKSPESALQFSNGIQRLRRFNDWAVGFSVTGIICMIIQNELAWAWNTAAGYGPFCPDPTDTTCDPRAAAQMFPITSGLVVLNAIRTVISAFTLVSVGFLYKYYATQLIMLKVRHLVPGQATLLGCWLRWPWLFETLIMLVHVFPLIESASQSPRLYLSMSLLMFLRLGFIARVIRYHSPLMSSNGRFIGALTNVEFDFFFIVKTTLKSHPVAVIGGVIATVIFCTAYSLRMIDSFACVTDLTLHCEPITLIDAAWLMIVTVLAIGYGDVVPHADVARALAVFAGVAGLIGSAVIVALMTSYLTLTRSESKVVAFLNKDANKRFLRERAARAMQAFFRYYSADKANGKRKALGALYNELYDFRQARKFVSANDPVSPLDRQITLLETMEVNVDDIKAHVELLSGYLLGVPGMIPDENGNLGVPAAEAANLPPAILPPSAPAAAPGVPHIPASGSNNSLDGSKAPRAAVPPPIVTGGAESHAHAEPVLPNIPSSHSIAHRAGDSDHAHPRARAESAAGISEHGLHNLLEAVLSLSRRVETMSAQIHSMQTEIQTHVHDTRHRLSQLEAAR